MTDTSGPSGETSSPSACLQSLLESKYRALSDVNGSPEYVLTWKHWGIKSGPSILALRARARRTSDNAYTGWPTAKRDDGVKSIRSVEGALKEARRKGANDLNTAAVLAGWGTPRASETGRHRSPESIAKSRQKGGSVSLEDQAHLAGRGTPTQRDWKDGDCSEADVPVNGLLGRQRHLAGWATPAAQEAGGTAEQFLEQKRKAKEAGKNLGVSLTSLSLQASGPTTESSPASTGKRGALNPALSRWLQGFPEAWCQAAIRASRKFGRAEKLGS